jgi:hypothetical protein
MSASLVVLLPVILLGIVSLFCFVGCHFPTTGEDPAFIGYANTVLGNPAIAAYWPLNDAGDSFPALDLAPNPDNGTYIDPNTMSGFYPWPAYTIGNPPGPNISSAAAALPPVIQFQQLGIVTGDFGVDTDSGNPTLSTSLVVNGCFVNVPIVPKISPTSFTVEAWVQVNWGEGDAFAWRAVLDARTLTPSCTGFAIIATTDDNMPGVYHWTAVIGNGGTGAAGFTILTSPDAITLNGQSTLSGANIYYLAVTYDLKSKTLTLYVNGAPSGAAVTNAVYVPNTVNPLWIGAGVPYVTQRTSATPLTTLSSPLFPFVGALQDVAIYSAALESGFILTHYHNGSGLTS